MTDNVRYHFLLCHYFHARVVSECEYGLLSTKNWRMSQDSGLNIVTKRLDLASFSADLIQNITDNGWRTGRMTHGRRFCPAIKYAFRSLGKKQTRARAKQILHNRKNLAMPTLPTVRRVQSIEGQGACRRVARQGGERWATAFYFVVLTRDQYY
jgi:hypothetical protein